MFKIGNIIYEDELVNHTKVDYINYIDMKNGGNDLNIPTDIPILFVGWNQFKVTLNDFHDKISILNKEIKSNQLYWEFSFNENKAQHVGGIEMFVRNAPYYYFRGKYTYKNIDPIFDKISNLENFKNILPNEKFNTFQYKDEMIYILDNNNNIFGIDLKMYEYFNFNLDKLTSILIDRSITTKHDIDGSIYQKQYKIFPFFEELKRYLVVLMLKP